MPRFEGDGTVALFAMGVFGGSLDQGFMDASERATAQRCAHVVQVARRF